MLNRKHNRFWRRGAAVPTVAVSGTVMIGFAAIAIDMGVFYNTRIEAQRSADAGALAGAWQLLGDDRVKGSLGVSTLVTQARSSASTVAGKNYVFKQDPIVDQNTQNTSGGDIVLGRLLNLADRTESLATTVPTDDYNAISVLVRRDEVRNGPIPFFFGQIFGFKTKDMSAKAVAAAQNRIAGYRVTPQSGNAQLLPFALQVECYKDLTDGTITDDNYRYDPVTKTVTPGSDGIRELNLYPGAGTGQLPPGNFGTVDIGSSNNSTADISRQIRYGVTAEDLAYVGGELTFDWEGKIQLNGDTGLSAAVKDDLEAIKGQPRAIPLFTTVSGPGNNAMYNVVKFAGIRIMYVKLTGSMKTKQVVIQPCVCVDDAVITDGGHEPSYYVYYPPVLVR